MQTSDILSYRVQAQAVSDCVSDISPVLQGDIDQCAWVACLNPHSYAVARSDSAFEQSLKAADWLVPDGFGILLGARILGHPVTERITGFDIFDGVMTELNKVGGSVFFLGSTDYTLELIAEKLGFDYPNVRLAGTYSPPFRPEFSKEDNDVMIAEIAKSNADVLWVGMTAPKQEKWIHAHSEKLPVKFAGAIGAVFDFYSGQVQRSHPFFQRVGLEWLPRLLQQPKRLWRRMFISAPVFLFDVGRQRLNLPYKAPSKKKENSDG